jgi:ribonuclease D
LNYAALDVEFLIELWESLSAQLEAANKLGWAIQEFEHVRDTTAPIVREEPWRRTSGLHGARRPRQLGIVRELWNTRDQIAQDQDIAPGRILPDSLFVAIATEAVDATIAIEDLDSLNGRLTRRNKKHWVAAVKAGLALSEEELPATRIKSSAPPPPRTWQEKNPEAWAQLEQVRSGISALSESLGMPVENLITPDTVRRILWTPPNDETELVDQLNSYRARPWQQELIFPLLRTALFEELSSTELASASES